MLTYALTYAHVCWRMLTYADVCWRKQASNKNEELEASRRALASALAGAQFTCFTGTKVQILTLLERRPVARLQAP
jgi:hypothetical protein